VIMIALERFWAVNGVGALISTRFWSFGLGKSMFMMAFWERACGNVGYVVKHCAC